MRMVWVTHSASPNYLETITIRQSILKMLEVDSFTLFFRLTMHASELDNYNNTKLQP